MPPQYTIGNPQNVGAGTTQQPRTQQGSTIGGPAVQAGVSYGINPNSIPQIGGAGPVSSSTIAPPVRDDEFIGLRTDVPEGSLPPNATPFAINWSDLERMGSISPRRGILQLSDNKDTINSASYAAYFGTGIEYVPPTDMSEASAKGGTVLISLANSLTMYASATNVGWIVRTNPLWAKHFDLDNVGGLAFTTLQDLGSQTMRIVIADAGRVNVNAVVAGTIRYSTTGYPVDIDGNDDFESTAIWDREAWDGSGTQIDTVVAAGTYYISAWAHSRLGTSQRLVGRLVIA